MLQINYLPTKKKGFKLEVNYFYWAAEAVVLLIFILIFNGVLTHKINAKENEIKTKQAEVERNKGLLKQIKEFSNMRAALEKKKSIIDGLNNDRQKWVRVIDTLCNIIPDQVWLTSFKGNLQSVNISGYGITILYINEFIKALQAQDNMFSTITLKYISSGKVPEIAQSIHKFEIDITLKSEVKK
jgi:Tfp pilus assembly protein PilN